MAAEPGNSFFKKFRSKIHSFYTHPFIHIFLNFIWLPPDILPYFFISRLSFQLFVMTFSYFLLISSHFLYFFQHFV